MLSLVTNGMICGPQIFCEDATPCEYQEDTSTNDEDEGPKISILGEGNSENLLDSDFNS